MADIRYVNRIAITHPLRERIPEIAPPSRGPSSELISSLPMSQSRNILRMNDRFAPQAVILIMRTRP
jgi:hypothetical protein